MGFEGTHDVYLCDDCGTKTQVAPGHDINRWPDWTNQTWTWNYWERGAKVRCPDCSQEHRKQSNAALTGAEGVRVEGTVRQQEDK